MEWPWQLPNLEESKLKPGSSFTITRHLIPARNSIDLKQIARTINNNSSVNTTIKAIDKNGPVKKARVDLLLDDSLYASGRTTESGELALSLAEGNECKVRITPPGRAAVEHQLDLKTIRKTGQTIELPTPGTVTANITDDTGNPIPCKVGFYGKDGTPDPDFGPDTFIYGVKNLQYTPDGKFQIDIQPGSYEVFISHGSEYDAVIKPIELTSGQKISIEAQLTRTVDTTGWLSAEFHSHSTPSGDNTSSQRGRVLNLLAEHLEFIPCTEHNRINTYDAHLEFFNATDRVITCPGMELNRPTATHQPPKRFSTHPPSPHPRRRWSPHRRRSRGPDRTPCHVGQRQR